MKWLQMQCLFFPVEIKDQNGPHPVPQMLVFFLVIPNLSVPIPLLYM